MVIIVSEDTVSSQASSWGEFAMHSRTKVGLDAIERIKHAFDALPPHLDEEVTKTQAIRLLIPHIETMRGKGYGLPAIVSLLSEHGVAITVSSLKTVLSPSRRAGEGKKKRKAGRKPHALPTAGGDPPAQTRRAAPRKTEGEHPTAATPAVGGAEEDSGRTQSNIVDVRREPRVGGPAAPTKHRAMFTPREDSDEI